MPHDIIDYLYPKERKKINYRAQLVHRYELWVEPRVLWYYI